MAGAEAVAEAVDTLRKALHGRTGLTRDQAAELDKALSHLEKLITLLTRKKARER